MSATYTVTGMTCQGCAKSVTNAIKAVDEAAEVSIDLEAKTVTVANLDDAAAIERAVTDAGFDFGGLA